MFGCLTVRQKKPHDMMTDILNTINRFIKEKNYQMRKKKAIWTQLDNK